jgi:hypothetical protein
MHYIYHLIDPITKKVRYVGKSTNPKSRLRSHIKESTERQNTQKKKWIYELINQGLEPIIVIVATEPKEEKARTIESEQCHKHRATIFNIHDPAKGAKDIAKQKPREQHHG